MPAFTDQTGHSIVIETPPLRIVSLVPSQTELLFDLGLDEQVVGITSFCIHPPERFYTKKRIGGTKKLHLDAIHQLQPDLIIANKEENVKEQVEELRRDYPVWTSDVVNLPTALEMIEQVGMLTGKIETAKEIMTKIRYNFSQLTDINNKPGTCYLIWNDPYMTVGGDTFINSMLEAAGLRNIFQDKLRYPQITIDDLVNPGTPPSMKCRLILLSSEPFPFKQKHIDELKRSFEMIGVVTPEIVLADGEMFSWYGSRLQFAPAYFKELLNFINLSLDHKRIN